MDAISFILVLSAAALHAGWNAFVKDSDDSFLRLGILYFTNMLIGLCMLPFIEAPDLSVLPYLACSSLIQGAYFFSLAAAYRDGDLSQVYPIARGLSPVLIAFAAWVLAGETPSPLGLAAIALICAALLTLGVPEQRGNDPKPALFALLTALFIAGYSTVDGLAVRISGSTMGYVAWIFIASNIIPLVAVLVMRRKSSLITIKKELLPGLLGGVMGGLGYGIVLWAMVRNPLASVSALRETSVIFAAWIGTRLLGETGRKRRLAASIGVVAGVILLQSSSAQ